MKLTYDEQMELVDRDAVRAWRHPVEELEPQSDKSLVEQFGDLLAPVFLFISSARNAKQMALRAWVVLYVVRLDLVDGETIAAYAKKVGMAKDTVHRAVKEFRALVPDFRPPHLRPLPPPKESFPK